MKYFIFISLLIIGLQANAIRIKERIAVGAEQIAQYQSILKNKKVALVVNQTSMVTNQHLVDYFIKNNINVTKIFGPEHGFRGTGDAGEKLNSEIDEATKLPIISLYGKHKKPTKEDFKNVDIVVFDIQDVGVRFYTYISTLQYVMEACAENKKQLIVMDRPNPNGHYIDGPVLESKFKSFVGMQSIPIVHGMTIGEYAMMLNGEKLLDKKVKCDLKVIKMTGYNHSVKYFLPVDPSPNLKTPSSIYLYPSLCLFEGTEVSVGRGTDHPFEMWGHPSYTSKTFSFLPKPNLGSKDPIFNGKQCFGEDLQMPNIKAYQQTSKGIVLSYIKDAYNACPNKATFFNSFFEKLAGNETLKKQIIDKVSDEKIRQSWKVKIDQFKKTRKKYLLYTDFE